MSLSRYREFIITGTGSVIFKSGKTSGLFYEASVKHVEALDAKH